MDDPFGSPREEMEPEMFRYQPEGLDTVDYLGESHDLVSAMTCGQVRAMNTFMDVQYSEHLGDCDDNAVNMLPDHAMREAIKRTPGTVMKNFTKVGPDGKMKPVSAEFYVSCILQWMWIICCSK